MAIQPRNLEADILRALVLGHNQYVTASISTNFHLTKMERTTYQGADSLTVAAWTIATADATTLDEAISLINEVKVYADHHFTDAVAHDTATSGANTVADATDTATCAALANDVKDLFNTHRTASNVHYTADDTNTITSADGTSDEAEIIALVNECKEQLNDHTQGALAVSYIDVLPYA